MENKKIIVCGSIAYDHLLYYPGDFGDIIKTTEEGMNISINVKDKSVEFGGTAGNIAYNLSLLGLKPVVIDIVGKDFETYKEWFNKNNIDISHVKIVDNKFSSSAYITTDNAGNQITSFYKGASEDDTDVHLKDFLIEEVGMIIISPTKKERMLNFAHEARFLNIPFIFDPGQVISEFNDLECISFLDGPKVLIFNQFELKIFMRKTKLSREDILEKVPILIETMRETGSTILTKDKKYYIKPVVEKKFVDPTGCGDAYRAGILFGLTNGFDLQKTGQMASLLATYNLESIGTQNHRFTLEDFIKRYEEVFGETINIIPTHT